MTTIQKKHRSRNLSMARALMMSLLLPGLGQVHNGEFVKGALFFLGFALAIPVFAHVAHWVDGPYFYLVVLLGVAISLTILVAGIVQALKKTSRQQSTAPKHMLLMTLLLPVIGYGAVLYPCSVYVQQNVLESFYVPSVSMAPGIVKGDYFFVSRRVNAPGFEREIQRGDIVVFIAPNHRTQYFVKRVIGLPGDTVELLGTTLRVNGANLTARVKGHGQAGELMREERAASAMPYRVQWAAEKLNDANDVNVKVPPGHVFVLGDNRSEAMDSRQFGPVPLGDVTGIAKQVWFTSNAAHYARIGTMLDLNI